MVDTNKDLTEAFTEIDTFIQEYLLFRGLTRSLATFLNELGSDNTQGLAAERVARECMQLARVGIFTIF